MWGKYHRTRDDTELARICGERDPSKAEVICPWDWELPPNMSNEDLRVFWGTPDFTPGEKDLLRMDLMKYTGKVANKFDILLRKEELSPEQFDQKRKEWSPYWVVDERKTYPPTFFLHGTADSAVPVEQSYRFAEKLKRLDVPTGEAYCPNGEHCFENKIEVSAGRVGSGRVGSSRQPAYGISVLVRSLTIAATGGRGVERVHRPVYGVCGPARPGVRRPVLETYKPLESTRTILHHACGLVLSVMHSDFPLQAVSALTPQL